MRVAPKRRAATLVIYLIDADTLIHAKNGDHPIGGDPGFWQWLANSARSGSVKMPTETYDEITDRGFGDDLEQWVLAQAEFLLLDESYAESLLDRVMNEGYGLQLTDVNLEIIGADPYLISYGLVDPANRTIISEEKSEPNRQGANRKVPDVCAQLKVMSGNLNTLKEAVDYEG